MNSDSSRILARGHLMSNNTWVTNLNNNDLIIGPSGAGKTRNYVKPNLLQCDHSLIIADTKGSLIEEVGPVMASHGFKVINLDFTDLLHNTWGYNPLDYVSYDSEQGKYSEQDIMTISSCLIPVKNDRDPFWEESAQQFLSALVAYVLEALPAEEHHLGSVCKLYEVLEDPNFDKLFLSLAGRNPHSYACRAYAMATGNKTADRTYASIKMFLVKNLAPLSFDGPLHMYCLPNRVDFKALGREKTAVFLTISDTDRSMDKLTNLLYTQALHTLCESADNDYPGHRLPVPVRFILDDFATNVLIPNFDATISVIRSREIYVSLIIQSVTQLYDLYGPDKGKTIINNCDNCLYLGGQDVDTANFISIKANKNPHTILNMPVGDVWLFTRGQVPRQVQKYDLTEHPLYPELPEAQAELQPAPEPELTPKTAPGFEPQPASPLAAEEREPGPWEIWQDKRDTAQQDAPSMSIAQFGELKRRKRRLAEEAARLEMMLFGRNQPILPSVADEEGHCSEARVWALVHQLIDAVRTYENCQFNSPLNLSDGDRACLRAFLYCAIRLSVSQPFWFGDMTGTYEDILRCASTADCGGKANLHFCELYAPSLLDGFFAWLDEAYQTLSDTDITDHICEADRLVVREKYWDTLMGMQRSWDALDEINQELDDIQFPDCDEDLLDEDEYFALASQDYELSQEREAWAGTFPARESFCRCCLYLRENFFDSRLYEQLPRIVENMLDIFLAGQLGAPVWNDPAFTQACAALDRAAEDVLRQNLAGCPAT